MKEFFSGDVPLDFNASRMFLIGKHQRWCILRSIQSHDLCYYPLQRDEWRLREIR